MRTLVIVPAYNEEFCIRGVIEDLRNNFAKGEILIINDGSQDMTPEVAKGLGVRVIDMPYNVGIGSAMQTGFLYAVREGYDLAIQFDGDGQHVASQIPRILECHLKKKTDIVVGSRFLSASGFTSSFQRKIGSKILSFVVSGLTGKKITDTTSGFRLYSRKTLSFFATLYPDDYPEVESLILAHKKGLSVDEVPAEMQPRAAGKSSITTTRAVYYMVKVLLAIFVDLLKRID